MRRNKFTIGASGAFVALLALTGCTSGGSSADASGSSQEGAGTAEALNGDISELCGDGEITVGFLKSNGGNPWTLQANAEFEDEASKCSNIVETVFAEAVNDQQRAISDLNSFVAQGVDILVVTPDYGPTQLPGIKQAADSGMTVVTVWDGPGGTGGVPGEDFVATVDNDYDAIAESWVEFLHEQLPEGGKVVYMGGPAVNNWTAAVYPATVKALEKYPELELVGGDWQVTNWDPAMKKQVMTGLLAQHGRIDAIISDYNGTDAGALQAYDDAGFERPALVGITPTNEIGCDWQKNPYPYMVYGGTSSITRAALRVAVGAHQATSGDNGLLKLEIPSFTYLPDGEQAPCNSDLPPDADLTADLSEEQMVGIFG